MAISDDYRIDALLRGSDVRWNSQQSFGTPTEITYGFMDAAPAYCQQPDITNFSVEDYATFTPLDTSHRDIVRQVFTEIENTISSLRFREVSDPHAAVIMVGAFAYDVNARGDANGYAPNGVDTAGNLDASGDVWFNLNSRKYDISRPGKFAETALHEIGHTLGLKHPADYGAAYGGSGTGNNAPPYLPTAEAVETNTVMALGGDYTGNVFRPYDILALNFLYGATTPSSGQWLLATGGSSVVQGSELNELIELTAGSHQIDGGTGVDTASYGGLRSQYVLTLNASGTSTVQQGVDNADTLTNVERLHFSDAKLGIDTGTTQSSGETALLIGAVLPGLLAFDPAKQVLLGSVIGLFDAGYSIRDLSGAVLRLPIWADLTGHATPTNTDIANYLLTNVNGLAPDQATLDAAANTLSTESFQGDWLAALVLSAANQAHVNLVGLAQSGLTYQ